MTAEQSKALATLDISRARRADADMTQSVTLVTGASGFLGKAVTKQLAENSVCTVGLDPRPSPTTHVVDALSDRQKLKMLLTAEKITHIIHAGGVSGPMVLADDPAEVIAINVLESLNLLYAALESGVGTFVYCSSAAALGNFYEDEPVDDQYPLPPEQHLQCVEGRNGDGAAGFIGQNSARPLLTAIYRDLRSRTRNNIYG